MSRRRGSADAVQRGHQRLELRRVVDVARPVQGDEAVAARAQAQARERLSPARLRQEPLQRVDHRVADEVDPGGVDALARQVLAGAALRGEQQVRELIGEQPVELLGHAAVAAAQTGLHVRRLGRVRARADTKVVVRLAGRRPSPRQPRCLSREVLPRWRRGAPTTEYALVRAHQRTIRGVCEMPRMTTYPPGGRGGAGWQRRRRTSTLSHAREVLLWPGTKRRHSVLATKTCTFTRDDIVDLGRCKILERRHLYALGV